MARDEIWRFNRFRDRFGVFGLVVVVSLLLQNIGLCRSLNNEGMALLRFREKVLNDPFGALLSWKDDNGYVDPCSWFGVECSDGKVVVLNLKDLCLEGTLAPELKNLMHIKSIILRNNCFTGNIPEGIGELKELEVLDLGYNNLCGPIPTDLGSNLSLGILLLDNNALLGSLSPEIYQLQWLSEFQVDENQLSNADQQRSLCNKKKSISCNSAHTEVTTQRRLLQEVADGRGIRVNPRFSQPPSSSPAPQPEFSFPPASDTSGPDQVQNKTSPPASALPPFPSSLGPSPSENPISESEAASSKKNRVAIYVGIIGGTVVFLVLAVGIYLYTCSKVTTVRPWATGLSGQLQKAFVTGVPNLKRSELETACEDFSNVIGFSPIGKVYKGTLSSGVEIAVASVAIESAKDWSKSLEVQFRKKIDTLSKVNHKNLVNLLGYCEEEEPFTRMMVFEYAPNGNLFEHLHIKESEHLDWGMRLRIAMGMAYCLEHMHQLNPPIPHNNLTSSAINLTEDYAAKISELDFWNEMASEERKSNGLNLLNVSPSTPENNVYSFGIILLEMMTGKLAYPMENGSFEDWIADYLRGRQLLIEIVDPTLSSFQEEQLEQIGEVLKSCLNPDPRQRPAMREVSARLRSITGMTPDVTNPKLSPLWWAELEIISSYAH